MPGIVLRPCGIAGLPAGRKATHPVRSWVWAQHLPTGNRKPPGLAESLSRPRREGTSGGLQTPVPSITIWPMKVYTRLKIVLIWLLCFPVFWFGLTTVILWLYRIIILEHQIKHSVSSCKVFFLFLEISIHISPQSNYKSFTSFYFVISLHEDQFKEKTKLWNRRVCCQSSSPAHCCLPSQVQGPWIAHLSPSLRVLCSQTDPLLPVKMYVLHSPFSNNKWWLDVQINQPC